MNVGWGLELEVVVEAAKTSGNRFAGPVDHDNVSFVHLTS
jgi:hypothetical protein